MTNQGYEDFIAKKFDELDSREKYDINDINLQIYYKDNNLYLEVKIMFNNKPTYVKEFLIYYNQYLFKKMENILEKIKKDLNIYRKDKIRYLLNK